MVVCYTRQNGFAKLYKRQNRYMKFTTFNKKRCKMSKQNEKTEAIKRLQSLQNIGPATAEKLYSIGIETPEQMKRSDPEEIYEKMKENRGGKLDKCVLYQFQGAVLDIPWWECKNLTKDISNQSIHK